MTAAAAPRRGSFVLVAAIVAALCVLIGLGSWQLQRRAEKESLIARLNTKLAAAPEALTGAHWDGDPVAHEFTRVTFSADFVPGEEALVYTSGSGLRPDVKEPGYWVLSPARLPDGRLVVVNRGFVPEGKQDPKTRPQGEPGRTIKIVGLMRASEPRGFFTPRDEPARNLWFVRDPAGMASAKGWGTIAPFYIDQEDPAAPGGLPRVGPLKVNLPNNHLQYAVTWYGLAAVLVGVAFFFLRSRRRDGQANAG